MSLEQTEKFRRRAADPLIGLQCKMTDKMISQQFYISLPFVERGQAHLENRKPVEQVTAEISAFSLFLKVAVGGRKNTGRSEEHTSELQSLMRTKYAVFC